MPIYEFECQSCEAKLERILPFEYDVQACFCGGELKKQLSTFGFTFNDGSPESLEKKATKHRKRARDHFVKQGRDEVIANGGHEWRAGDTIDKVQQKAYPKIKLPVPESHKS